MQRVCLRGRLVTVLIQTMIAKSRLKIFQPTDGGGLPMDAPFSRLPLHGNPHYPLRHCPMGNPGNLALRRKCLAARYSQRVL